MSHRYEMKRIFLALVCGLLASASTIVAAVAQEAKWRPGPAAWVEEYWDVKPEKFDEFVAAYKRDVYATTRKIPGYRGYLFLTTIPDANGFPDGSNPKLKKLTTNHYGITLDGKVETKRLIDVGNLLRQTHNVVIVHSLQTWADADNFRKTYAKIFAATHNGEDASEHLAKTLYPLANNYWESDFRLSSTGRPLPSAAQLKGSDADGLNLEPHPSADFWGKEYFDVAPSEMKAFLDAYEHETYQVMRPIKGYQGVEIVVNTPPSPEEAKITRYSGEPLGTADTFYMAQPGVMMDGEIRTNIAVNFSLLFNRTFTIITYYVVPQGSNLLKEMQANFDKQHPGVGDRLPFITKVLFSHARNHWDMVYRAVETSFVPTPPTAAPK